MICHIFFDNRICLSEVYVSDYVQSFVPVRDGDIRSLSSEYKYDYYAPNLWELRIYSYSKQKFNNLLIFNVLEKSFVSAVTNSLKLVLVWFRILTFKVVYKWGYCNSQRVTSPIVTKIGWDVPQLNFLAKPRAFFLRLIRIFFQTQLRK